MRAHASPLPVAVGLIGAGNMGGAMVQRLAGLGAAPLVHDVDPAACDRAAAFGAPLAPHPQAVAASLAPEGVLIVVVVDAAQTEAVLWGPQGAATALRPGQTVLLCPTLGPQTVAEQARRLAERGVDLLDAPMSGGPVRAAQGRMSLMVAGPEAAWQRVLPLLRQLADPVHRIGPRAGDAARTKLVNNLLAATVLAASAEALALAEQLGLDPAQTLAVIQSSSGQSWIAGDRLPRALAGDLAPRAHLSLLAKDSTLAMQAAADAGLQPPLGQLAQALFARGMAQGLAEQDDAAMLGLLRQVLAEHGRAP